MRFAPLLLAAVCALVLFTGLDGIGLVDVREARDAEVAREIIADREFLLGEIGHEPLFEKPLLAYAPEVAARLSSPRWFDHRSRLIRALAAVMLIAVTTALAARHFGPRAAWCSGLTLASTIALPLAARTDGTQLFASILGWVGAAGLADAVFGRGEGRDRRLVVTYGALAVALACAGPWPALWPLAGLAVYLLLARDRDGWRRVQLGPGLVLMAGVALPFYGATFERYGVGFLGHAPFFPYAIGSRGPWYSGLFLTPSFLVVGFFPWSTLLPGALLHAATSWRTARAPVSRAEPAGSGPPAADPLERERSEKGAAHFFIACLIASLVPIVIYPGPPLPAVLPALPAAALLCGRLLDHLLEDARRLAPVLTRSVLLLAVFGSVGAALITVVAPRVREATPEIRLLATVLFVTSWAPFLANLLGRRSLAAALMLLPVGLGAPVITLRLMPALEGYLSARPVAEAMNDTAPRGTPLLVLEQPPPSFRLYLWRNLVVTDRLGQAVRIHRATDGFAYVAFRPSREHEVAGSAGVPLEILVRTPSMVLARVHRE